MVARTHSKATKLAAVTLYRLAGEKAAVLAFGVDVQTVRAWANKEPPPVDDWEQAEQLLLARGLEMSARGQTQGLVATLTAAGISSRNRRYSELIRRREARRTEEQPKPEEPDPVKLALHALRRDQKRLIVDWIDTIGEERQADPDVEPTPQSDEEHQAAMLKWLAGVAALTEDEVATRVAELSARRDALEQQAAEARNATLAQPPQNAPEPVATAPDPIPPLQPAPEPSQALPAPSKPYGLHVVSDQERNDPFSDRNHPSWRSDR